MQSRNHRFAGRHSRPSEAIRRLGPWVFGLLMLIGCGDESSPASDTGDTSGPIDSDADTSSDTDTGTSDADTAEVDILYPGNLCDEDEQCATGLCYGNATSQGFFEPAKCQSRCLDLFDYTRYCDSDSDCCKGRCCLGCGGQEGLCILQ